jgi:hypothetical protein
MTMTPEQLLENFKTQQQTVADEIRKLDAELAQKKELYVKLQGAIEGLTLLNPEDESGTETTTIPEASAEAIAEVVG